ncbi:unnamed protein product [Caenorhabditis auriculariae]|uniref:Tetraspanin n=1 Tax=Caenorhabditis auriculariae TaxID=2777116 RepID=A0A8S1HN88_9PELO|nr:unnamed protein product [Caenorhabditis auriculariae]
MANQRRTAAGRANSAQRVYRQSQIRYAPGAGGESEISCCVKYSVFGFNVIFFLLGVTLLLIGTWAQIEKNNIYSHLNKASKLYLDPTWLLLVVGLLTFIIGFSGCVGSLRENTSFLTFYSTLLGLLLIAEFSVAVFAYVRRDQLDMYIRNLLNDVVVGYRDDPDLQVLIDTMQESWKCCGINGADDWDRNTYFSIAARNVAGATEAGGVPFSCCVNSSELSFKNFYCGHGVRLKQDVMHRAMAQTASIYTEGCLPKLQLWLNNNVLLVGVSMIIIAIIQVLGICFAQNLKSDVFAQRAKWLIRTALRISQLFWSIFVSAGSSGEVTNSKRRSCGRNQSKNGRGNEKRRRRGERFHFEAEGEPLPQAFIDFVRKERPFKIAASVAFILYTFFFFVPLMFHATSVYRAPFPNVSPNHTINLPIRVILATTDPALVPVVKDLLISLEADLSKIDVVYPLQIDWITEFGGLRDYEDFESNRDILNSSSSTFDVHVAIVEKKRSGQWKHFSATNVQLGVGKWSFVQWLADSEEGASKAAFRVSELVADILLDVPHLNSIVRRDLRERMAPWQIATLPLSHQKRLVWDSAPLAMNYHVQVIHVHDNVAPTPEELELQRKTPKALRIFGKMVERVTNVEVSSEHLWDFDVTRSFLEKDVQERLVLTHDNMQQLLKQVEAQLPTSLDSGAVLRVVVLETANSVTVLDQMGEDSNGLAVASWGAVLARNEKTESRAIAALRIHIGMDAELMPGWSRPPAPLCEWEVARARLRACVDNGMRAASAIRALNEVADKITNIVINDDVAERATRAVQLLFEGLKPGQQPDYEKLVEARKLADSANSDHSLLSLLYFPMDQRFAVFLPIVFPICIATGLSFYRLSITWLTRSWL